MSFFSVILSSDTSKLVLLLCMSLIHGIHGFIFSSIPFLFLDPIFVCGTDKCDQSLACPITLTKAEISKLDSPISITTEYELICDKRFLKASIQMIALAGTTISGFYFSMFSINPNKRGYLMVGGVIGGGIFGLICGLSTNLIFITIFMFFYFLFTYIWYANVYTFGSENFEMPLKKTVPSILTSSYGIGTMVFSLITLLIKSWRNLIIFFYAIPITICGLAMLCVIKKYNIKPLTIEKVESNEESEKNKKNWFSLLKDKNYRKNALIYLFLWNMNSISYNGCDIALGSLSSPLVVTMFFLGFEQCFCSLLSGSLILKYQEEKIIRITTILMTIFFGFYLFEPQNKSSVSFSTSIFFLVCIVVANFGIEINWTVLVNLMQKYMPIDYQQIVFSGSDTLSLLLSLILPYYIEFMSMIGISPLFGFAFLSFVGRILVTQLKEIEIKKVEEIDTDTGVEMKLVNN